MNPQRPPILELAQQVERLGSAFCVDSDPFLVCDSKLKKHNLDFLSGIDGQYFEFVARTALAAYETDKDSARATVMMRISLHHGLETLFSLLGALVQAPDCIFGWIYRCTRAEQLRNTVRRIGQKDDTLPRKLNLPEVSWAALAGAVFSCSHMDPGEVSRNVRNFSQLWERLSSFFLEQSHMDEYNALKHGFRVRAGGFKLAIGNEETPGTPPPEEAMQLLVDSKWGAMFMILSPAYAQRKEGRLTSVPTHISMNWSVEQTARLLQLVGTSIANVASAARIANGVPPSEVAFHRPQEDEIFSVAWQSDLAVASLKMNVDAKIPVTPLSRDELLGIVQLQTEVARSRGCGSTR